MTSARYSQYFIPTLKEIPADASVISHQLMLRAGMIQMMSSGIYAWLPLGLKVLNKLSNIVRYYQDTIGSEMLAPTMQPEALWKKSGRYDLYGPLMLQAQDRHGKNLIYGPTAEEVFIAVASQHCTSYRQLPQRLYNIQWHFRDEIRPRHGVMRGREFCMKAAYSFDITTEDALKSYDLYFEVYQNTFKAMGITVLPMFQRDTGEIGGELSHEWILIAPNGESDIVYDNRGFQGAKGEKITRHNTPYACELSQHKDENCDIPIEFLTTSKGIEIGHTFFLGTSYAKSMDFKITNELGESVYPYMGCFGIGVSRLIAAIIEANHDSEGIIWPEAVSPFDLGILVSEKEDCMTAADQLYDNLRKNMSVLYDDRSYVNIGGKIKDMTLLGLSYYIIIGKEFLETGKVDLFQRRTKKKIQIKLDEILQYNKESIWALF